MVIESNLFQLVLTDTFYISDLLSELMFYNGRRVCS